MQPIAAILGRLADRGLASISKSSPTVARFAGGRLARQHRFVEAEALLARSAIAFPRHAGVLARHALIAQLDGRLLEAAERWKRVCVLAPGRARAWSGLASAARLLGDTELATEAITHALSLRPGDRRLLVEAARVHDRADRPNEAIGLWSQLASRRGADPIWRQGYADCLIRLHRLDEAEEEIESGLARHPGHRGLVASKALLAMRREDWESAAAIWSAYAAAYPEDKLGREFLSRVESVWRLATASKEETPISAPDAVPRVEDDVLRGMMLRFEGIGTDCEFGKIQRRYGAEPLGLLRWNDVDFPTLAAALEARFARMGEPEMTELFADRTGLLYVRDRRWDLGMHTFLFDREVSRNLFFPKMCRRVAYLRDKLLADLESAEKVFVYKANDLSYEELVCLHRLLREHGPVRLLHVRDADWSGIPPWPHGTAGTVATIAPDLFVGYVDWLGDLDETPYDDWVAVCRATLDLVDSCERTKTPATDHLSLLETGG